ncbi:chemotaxis protein CheY [Achromatium sp. WMS3]|nr:chemotaxis protein CheY [Achromatium sp. WMS3]
MYTKNTVTILLVEDDEIDAEAIHRGFAELKIANPIKEARDGIEALDILRGTGGQQQIYSPYLILLDINMPRMNGLEFLQAIRQDPELKTAIIFILTTSNDDRDRFQAYENHVAGYILKNNAGESFIEAIKMLKHYWTIIEFPPRGITKCTF